MQFTQLQRQRIDRLYYVIVFDEWDEEKHPRKKNGQFGKGGSQSAMKSVKANIKRGQQAMNTAIAEKRTVHRAMYHNSLGWVDFEWGDEGYVKNNGKTKGAMGISHIIEARMRKDGVNYHQVTRMLSHHIVNVIAKGQVVNAYERGNVQNVKIDYDGYRAALRKAKGSNAWIVTAFELFEDANRKG